MKKYISRYLLISFFLLQSLYAKNNHSDSFIEEVYTNLPNLDVTILPYISKELILGANGDTNKLIALRKYVNKLSNRSEIERENKFISLLMCALRENTKRLHSAQPSSDPFPDYYNTKGFEILIELSNKYYSVQLQDSEVIPLLTSTDATIINYHQQVFSALFCVYASEFINFMERNMNKFSPDIIEAYKTWWTNPNPIYKNEMEGEPIINYSNLLKSVSLGYERIGISYKSERFNKVVNELRSKLK